MDPMETVRQIEKFGKLFEVAHVWTFKGYREAKDGGTYEITVEVHEHPPGAGSRYHVVATDERGRQATGNGGDTLDIALATLHWFDLDRDR